MTTVTIAEAADRTGFTPSALRFYEDRGLVVPDRSIAGYRLYAEHHLDQLRFVRRGKALGLALDEIAALTPLVAGDHCAPVQDRLRELLDTRIVAAETQATELLALTQQLRDARAGLDGHTPDGPCDEGCGCTSHPASDPASHPASERCGDHPPIACTLGAGQIDERLTAWRTLADDAATVRRRRDGITLEFDPTVDLRPITELISAEHACCAFLGFHLAVVPGAVELTISGPEGARAIIDALVNHISGDGPLAGPGRAIHER
jgi:MerR family transcriptional regulator, copper efflux regulator